MSGTTPNSRCRVCSSPPACLCTCQTPPLPLCEKHYFAHINSATGTHTTISISRAAPEPKVAKEWCEECRIRAVSCTCCCTFPAKRLCSESFEDHVRKRPALVHRQQPLPKSRISTSERKQTFLDKMIQALQLNLEKAEDLENQIETFCETLRKEIIAQKEAKIQQLKTLRQGMKLEVAKYIDKIEELRVTDKFMPRNALEELILNGWKEGLSLDILQVFSGKLNVLNVQKIVQDIAEFGVDYSSCMGPPKVRSSSESPVLRGNSSSVSLSRPHDPLLPGATRPQMSIQPKPPSKTLVPTLPSDSTSGILPAVFNNVLQVYDLPSGIITSSAKLSHNFNSGTVYCMLNKETVLCVGSDPPCPKVYSLDLALGALLPDSHMNIDRAWPGIIKVGEFVYVFGGNWPSVRSVEKFGILSHNWTFLPRMQNPRYAFSPCLHQGLIYLCDLCNSRVLETFSVLSEEFSTKQVLLPDIKCNCVTFIVNGEMLVVTNSKHLARWTIGGGNAVFEVSSIELPCKNAAISCCPIVMVAGKMFYVQYDTGEIRSFNPALSTLS